jgi:nucleoside recognition membrane protein YjiH
MLRTSPLDQQNFGSLLGATVQKTSITLLTIGGFITIFSVLIGILEAAGFFNTLILALTPVAQLFRIDASLLRALMYGLFEITIGINVASKSSGSFLQQLLVIEALLAWNGLSAQAQVAGMMVGSDLRLWFYLLTRCLQVPIAVLLAYLVTLLPVRDYLAGGTVGAALAAPPGPPWFPWVSGACIPAGIVLVLFSGYTLHQWCVRLKKVIIIR